MPKVMLVEDDNNLREIYQARLQAEGYEIVSAKDGEEGLVIAKAEKPDLIIADVMMPKISGFEMLDILRNTEGLKEVKVIMLTALGQSEDQQRANSLGADRYLVKSQVTLEDIVKATHELLAEEGLDKPGAAPATKAAQAPSQPPADTPVPTPTNIPVAQPPADDENRIENFVAGATEDPTPPASAPVSDNAAADDKLVADAAQTLIDSTKAKPEEPAKADQPAVDSEQVPIAHKKVIKPLDDSAPKKDINSLLAEEEAKEAEDKPSGAAPTSPGEPAGDAPDPTSPGNIAI